MNDDKVLELLIKLQQGQDELRQGQDEFRQETNARLDNLETIVLRMEQDHGKKLDALFDGYSVNFDKNAVIESELAHIKSRVDKMEMQIKFISPINGDIRTYIK